MKRRMINCTVEAVEKLFYKNEWRKIFYSFGNLRISSDVPLNIDDYICDQPSSPWEILERDGITVYPSDAFLTSIINDPHALLDYPKDIFIIDMDSKSKASKVKYGIPLLTEKGAIKSANTECLKIGWEETLRADEEYSWNRFFTDEGRDMSKVPSNSLIIIDRYLFAEFFRAKDNVCSILEEILPRTFDDTYHILFIADPSQFKKKSKDKQLLDTQFVATELYNAIMSVRRPYHIIVELLALQPIENYNWQRATDREKAHFNIYNITHNRRIVSNTFVIRADHKLCAIKQWNGIQLSNTSQTIRFDANFSGVKEKKQKAHSLPIKVADDIISALSVLPDNHFNIGRYFLDGVEGKSENIINRLLRR